jgi:hypothetical protein
MASIAMLPITSRYNKISDLVLPRTNTMRLENLEKIKTDSLKLTRGVIQSAILKKGLWEEVNGIWKNKVLASCNQFL